MASRPRDWATACVAVSIPDLESWTPTATPTPTPRLRPTALRDSTARIGSLQLLRMRRSAAGWASRGDSQRLAARHRDAAGVLAGHAHRSDGACWQVRGGCAG